MFKNWWLVAFIPQTRVILSEYQAFLAQSGESCPLLRVGELVSCSLAQSGGNCFLQSLSALLVLQTTYCGKNHINMVVFWEKYSLILGMTVFCYIPNFPAWKWYLSYLSIHMLIHYFTKSEPLPSSNMLDNCRCIIYHFFSRWSHLVPGSTFCHVLS